MNIDDSLLCSWEKCKWLGILYWKSFCKLIQAGAKECINFVLYMIQSEIKLKICWKSVSFELAIIYKYWLLMREIVQNNSPRWLETVGYYISRDEVEGNIGPRSPVNEGSYFTQFPDYRAVNICFI